MYVMKCRFIYDDENGVTRFDRYFEYLVQVSGRMPAALSEFALDPRRYELTGPLTLHDAWLETLLLDQSYEPNSNSLASRSVRVRLLLANQNRLDLDYRDVTCVEYSAIPSQWPDKAKDLLVHEFQIAEAGSFSHLIQFDGDVWLRLTFKEMSWSDAVQRHPGTT